MYNESKNRKRARKNGTLDLRQYEKSEVNNTINIYNAEVNSDPSVIFFNGEVNIYLPLIKVTFFKYHQKDQIHYAHTNLKTIRKFEKLVGKKAKRTGEKKYQIEL